MTKEDLENTTQHPLTLDIDLYHDTHQSIEKLLENSKSNKLDDALFLLGQDYEGLMKWIRRLPSVSEPTEVQYRRTLELLAGQSLKNKNTPLKESQWTFPNNYPSFFDSASIARAIEELNMSKIRTHYTLVLAHHMLELVSPHLGLLVHLDNLTNVNVFQARLKAVEKIIHEKMPQDTQKERAYSWLTLAEIESLFAEPDPTTIEGLRLLAMLWLLAGCMLRRNEASNAKFEDIQKSGNEYKLKVHGKGAKNRSVRIPVRFMRVIEELQQNCGGEYILKRFTRGRDENGSPNWREPLSGHSINKIVGGLTPVLAERVALGNGLFKLHPDDLRRSGARAFYEAGWSILAISKALGHSTSIVTEKFIGLSQYAAYKTVDPFD